MYLWNYKTYWGWYKCIRFNASNKAIRIEAGVKVVIEDWYMQWPKGLITSDKKRKFDK